MRLMEFLTPSPDMPMETHAVSVPLEERQFLNGVDPYLHEYALQHYQELAHELSCETPSEKVLCQAAAGAIGRHLSASRMLKNLMDEYWSATNRRTRRPTRNYTSEYEESWYLVSDYAKRIATISKEVDRSLRQYQSIVNQIRQIKSPVPEVRIQTAFVAQNQQFNAKNNRETTI